MRDILFLAHRIPYPPDRGDKIRSWNILKHLAGLARVHLACFADDEADAAQLPALCEVLGPSLGEAHVETRRKSRIVAGAQALASGTPVSLTLFDSVSMRGFVARQLARPEVGTIFVFSGQMAQFVTEGARQRFVMDFVDCDSAKFAQYAEETTGPMAWIYRREAQRLSAFECATAARGDVSLFVSEAEAELFRRNAAPPHADIRVIQNGIDFAFYDPQADFPRLEQAGQGPLIVFTGQMDYPPNIDAVTVFAREVMPLIRAHQPEARFAIVGRKPTDAVLALASLPGIEVTGEVPDVRSWLAAADLVVAPLRIARGIQNKLLEAMAMARPAVASNAAFEGIDAAPGRDLLVADAAEAQAKVALELLAAPAKARAIGAAARLQMERCYRWDAKLAALAEIVGAERKAAA